MLGSVSGAVGGTIQGVVRGVPELVRGCVAHPLRTLASLLDETARCSVYLIFWYKSTNTDTPAAHLAA